MHKIFRKKKSSTSRQICVFLALFFVARVGWEEVEATDTAIHANAQEALEPASAPSEGEGEGEGVGDDGSSLRSRPRQRPSWYCDV